LVSKLFGERVAVENPWASCWESYCSWQRDSASKLLGEAIALSKVSGLASLRVTDGGRDIRYVEPPVTKI
jgi:hypothetical protein